MEDWAKFIKEHFSNNVPFIKFMDIKVEKTAKGYAKISMPVDERHGNTYGVTHGGIVAAIVDLAGGIALRTLKVKIVTIETSTTYFKPTKLGQRIYATANYLNGGKKVLHATVEITDEQGEVIAGGRGIYYVLGEDDGIYKED